MVKSLKDTIKNDKERLKIKQMLNKFASYNLLINQVIKDGIVGYLWHQPLIATNGRELAALKPPVERNYIDVKLGMDDRTKRFADITLTLKSIDPKQNRYTVDVAADDKVTEKKDKALNEQVQFYTAKGGHTPYELVITRIDKNEIAGYLATPRERSSR